MLTPSVADKGGEASIEHPARVRNVAWQTRTAALTPAEDALAGALQSLFGEGVADLAAVAARLQTMIPPPAGTSAWSAEVLRAELARLGV
ncbi:MAG: recombinase-like helix-turn-helix domain-containing protein [Stellaceae bacterium]